MPFAFSPSAEVRSMFCVGFAAFCWFGALLVALFVGSALLRAGIGLANRTIGKVQQERVITYGDWDSDDEDEDIVVSEGKLAIPEPGIGRGMLIVFLASLVGAGITYVLMAVLDGPLNGHDLSLQVAMLVIQVAIGFVVLTGLLTWMLPTQPKWAATAAGYTYLIIIALGVLIYALVAALFRL